MLVYSIPDLILFPNGISVSLSQKPIFRPVQKLKFLSKPRLKQNRFNLPFNLQQNKNVNELIILTNF